MQCEMCLYASIWRVSIVWRGAPLLYYTYLYNILLLINSESADSAIYIWPSYDDWRQTHKKNGPSSDKRYYEGFDNFYAAIKRIASSGDECILANPLESRYLDVPLDPFSSIAILPEYFTSRCMGNFNFTLRESSFDSDTTFIQLSKCSYFYIYIFYIFIYTWLSYRVHITSFLRVVVMPRRRINLNMSCTPMKPIIIY